MPTDAHHQTEPQTQRLDQEPEAPRAQSSELQRGDVLAARYEIQDLLGTGGMASVYRAFDRVSEQTIAIKVLDDDRSAGRAWVELLGRELRHSRRVKHPNICQVFDFSEEGGRCFLTMELAPGGTLRATLDASGGQRPLTERLADARAVIDGVAAIHEAGVVHRDLKPENLLRAADGRLMVADLGVAVRADLTTHSGGPAGTRSYMAPELLFGEKASRASDVWSLGVILHEILFGARPEWSMAGTVRRLNVPAAATGTTLPGLARLCAACLVEMPDKRIPDALALRRRFDEAMRGGPSRRSRIALFVGVASLILTAATLLATRQRRQDEPHGILTGTAVDLAKSSPIFTINRNITRCAQMLPGGRTLRLFLRQPLEAIDVDVAGGGAAPSKLVPEAMVSGCPQLSPDGRRLLFERPRKEGRPQVFLSDWPDGRDARVVTEGDGPYWLPSGDAFLYAVDATRSAVFSLDRGPVLFPDPGTGPRTLAYHGVGGRGDQIAILSFASAPSLKVSLDVFSYPQTALLRRIELPLASCPWIEFDPGRGSWQVSVADPRHTVRCELREDGSCARLLRLEGANVVSAYRSQLGMVGVVIRSSRRAIVTRKIDGKDQEYVYEGQADFGPGGEALFGVPSGDGQWRLALQRFGEPGSRVVTPGPLDVAPSINPDGRTFLYLASRAPHDVQMCKLDAPAPGDCRVLHTDALGPINVRLSPDGHRLAYNVADAGGWRLRVVPLDGGPMRDLSLLSAGAILWTSDTTLWSCESEYKKWSEVDAISGRFTGKSVWRPDSDVVCDDPPPGAGALANFEVRRETGVTTEVHLVKGM